MKTSTNHNRQHRAAQKARAHKVHGETLAVISGHSVPRLPHEHDESSSSQAGEVTVDMKRTYEDALSNAEDTDRGPPMDELYQRQFRSKQRKP